MDYLRSERQQQHALLRAALMDHVCSHPEALIVIEEYDKLDCATRGFFRQLLENARTANVSLDRCCPRVFPGLAMKKQELCSKVRASSLLTFHPFAGLLSCWSPMPGTYSCMSCCSRLGAGIRCLTPTSSYLLSANPYSDQLRMQPCSYPGHVTCL